MNTALTPPLECADPSFRSGLDKPLTVIQAALDTLPWLSESLGRIVPLRVDGKTEPWLRRTDTPEYYLAYPNDTLTAFSCLYAHDDEQYEKEILVRRTVSVIVWANLQTLAMDLERLKADVWKILRELDCVMQVKGSKDQTTSGATGIYPGFNLSGLEDRYMAYPYGAFRIETVVHYADLCY